MAQIRNVAMPADGNETMKMPRLSSRRRPIVATVFALALVLGSPHAFSAAEYEAAVSAAVYFSPGGGATQAIVDTRRRTSYGLRQTAELGRSRD